MLSLGNQEMAVREPLGHAVVRCLTAVELVVLPALLMRLANLLAVERNGEMLGLVLVVGEREDGVGVEVGRRREGLGGSGAGEVGRPDDAKGAPGLLLGAAAGVLVVGGAGELGRGDFGEVAVAVED